MGIWTDTPGLMDKLKELWDADELTAKQIAVKLSETFPIKVTEDAVIGTANREKMKARPGYRPPRDRTPRPSRKPVDVAEEMPEEKRTHGGHIPKKPTLPSISADRFKVSRHREVH